MRCDDLEGWDGGGREATEEEDARVHTGESHCYTAETNTTL